MSDCARGGRGLSQGAAPPGSAPSPTRPIRSAPRCGRDEGVPLRRSGGAAPCATRPARAQSLIDESA